MEPELSDDGSSEDVVKALMLFAKRLDGGKHAVSKQFSFALAELAVESVVRSCRFSLPATAQLRGKAFPFHGCAAKLQFVFRVPAIISRVSSDTLRS